MKCCKNCALWTPELKVPRGIFGYCNFDVAQVQLPVRAAQALVTTRWLWRRTLESEGSDCSTFQEKGG